MESLDVAQGLEYLHGEEIIHGDMKGVSVMMKLCLAYLIVIYSSSISSFRVQEEHASLILVLLLQETRDP